MLSSQLVECGITTDILMEAMEKPSGARVKRLLMSNIVPVDDFSTFKKMMVKRNIELEQEVLKQFEGVQGTPQSGIPADNELDEEQEMIRRALEESRREAEALRVFFHFLNVKIKQKAPKQRF